ncbi:uncharacterized protein EV422DRAFT_502112 [Fimicolochytrium jonesii]|uniref:uncharacterized protein n=1 Tax=Fimicolochytrium jonesii TaxID=1396493 RepID=UPI0022FE51C8|nr:uncharacterized protein EV422DRAFT_502112 [Fimicolochytrium jonesii]KAI8815703.1 hypothetical protein EV422DRAFT_502112 [Fimicolochytrium jonesii]
MRWSLAVKAEGGEPRCVFRGYLEPQLDFPVVKEKTAASVPKAGDCESKQQPAAVSAKAQKKNLRKDKRWAYKREAQILVYLRAERNSDSDVTRSELISDIEEGDPPTRYIIVLNAGSTGNIGSISAEALESVFATHAGFERVEMLLGKAYSYIVFETPESALKAYHSIQDEGRELPLPQGGSKRLLLTFAKSISRQVALTNPAEVSNTVPGLALVHDFVTSEEEANLLASVDHERDSPRWIDMLKRRVQHYGFRFDYALNDVDLDSIIEPMPAWAEPVLQRYRAAFPEHESPDQLTVNEYWPGAGIGPHADRHTIFGDVVVALSLGSGVVMEFRRLEEASYLTYNVHLPSRSLLVISGEARYRWEHSIRARGIDIVHGRPVERGTRVSLTFRNVKRSGERTCECEWTSVCDRFRDSAGRAVVARPEGES